MGPDLPRRLAVARGDEPADLVIRGGKVLSVFTREWLDVDVAVVDGWIAGLGEYEGRGLIEGDPEGLLRRRRVLGLAEMMNFPGVISGDPAELAKLKLDGAAHVDGHAPGVLGRELNAYVAAGIRSDHEALTVEEGRQRLRAGVWLLIREASMARNLHALAPLITEFGPSSIAFCTDDRDPEDIVDDGHINGMVRKAVEQGVPPEDALVVATLNPARWHGLHHLGAIAPGYQADILVLPDLDRFEPETVLKAGRAPGQIERPPVPEWVQQSGR